MYEKPQLVRYGSLRELTQLGFNQDCDGGIYGIGDGSWWLCETEDRS